MLNHLSALTAWLEVAEGVQTEHSDTHKIILVLRDVDDDIDGRRTGMPFARLWMSPTVAREIVHKLQRALAGRFDDDEGGPERDDTPQPVTTLVELPAMPEPERPM